MRLEYGNTIAGGHVTGLIKFLFLVSIGMLKYFYKSAYVSVDLLTDEDYKKLDKAARKKAFDITEKIFDTQKKIEVSYFTNAIEFLKMKWITQPHLICDHLLKEADISIDLRCYDNGLIEARAKQRAEWIAEYNKRQQEE